MSAASLSFLSAIWLGITAPTLPQPAKSSLASASSSSQTEASPAFGNAHQNFPTVLPTRDVEVDYADRKSRADQVAQRMFFSAETGIGRFENDPEDINLTDFRTNADTYLDLSDDIAVEMSPDLAKGFLDTWAPPVGSGMTVLNRRTIAGLECTEFRFVTKYSDSIRCLTDDGITLAIENESRGAIGMGLTAIAVHFGKLSPLLFEIPSNFTITH